jgi:hypothetical protein
MPPDIAGVELDVETEETHNKLDNHLLNLPPKPDYAKILFSPKTDSASLSPASHAEALSIIKELLQQKERIAKVRYDARIRTDPNDIECGAQLFGNQSGLARNMPDGLKEFNIHLIPGVTPRRQRMRRFTAEETQEIRRPVTNMLA